MSVVFATFSSEYVSLCGDKRSTNLRTGKFHDDAIKVKLLFQDLAIGYAGNQVLTDIIISAAYDYIKEENISHSVEEIADVFCQAFYAAQDTYLEMPKGLVVKFIIAGKVASGKMGVGDIFADDNGPDLEIYEGGSTPSTLILAPEDLSNLECNLLFRKAFDEVKAKDKKHRDIIETIHRKAIKNVSEISKYVGDTSDYIFMNVNNI